MGLLCGEAKFSFNREMLGQVLGPAKGEGNEMAQWILKANGFVVPLRTCRPLNTSKIHSEDEKKKRNIFNSLIKAKLGTSLNPPREEIKDESGDLDLYEVMKR